MRLQRHKFLMWLKAKQPEEIVGENRDCHACPIAQFYVEASGGCEIVIFARGGEHFIDRGYSTLPLPRWAENFVLEVDGDENGKITAARALEALAA
jgi:hypothetical protein